MNYIIISAVIGSVILLILLYYFYHRSHHYKHGTAQEASEIESWIKSGTADFNLKGDDSIITGAAGRALSQEELYGARSSDFSFERNEVHTQGSELNNNNHSNNHSNPMHQSGGSSISKTSFKAASRQNSNQYTYTL
jgi:hypothetical protein